jgi:hypothetical protein
MKKKAKKKTRIQHKDKLKKHSGVETMFRSASRRLLTPMRTLATKSSKAYPVVEHEYDALVIGAGGAGCVRRSD